MFKLILSTSVLICSVAAVPVFNGFVCPADDNCVVTGCLYQNPRDCTTFWQCHGDRATLKQCPDDLEFNADKRVCDWAPSPTCKQTSEAPEATEQPSTEAPNTDAPITEEPTTEALTTEGTTVTEPSADETTTEEESTETTTEEPNTETEESGTETTTEDNGSETTTEGSDGSGTETTTQESDTETDTETEVTGGTDAPTEGQTEVTDSESTTGNGSGDESTTSNGLGAESTPGSSDFVCPIDDIAQTKCKGDKDCLYPNPENSNTFIQCTVNADDVTGTPVVMPCAANLVWNDSKKECDYPKQSKKLQRILYWN